MKLLELRGPNSADAMTAFVQMMYGSFMFSGARMHCESPLEFLEMIDNMPESDQEKVLKEAILFVGIESKEIPLLSRFATDDNGVPYTNENMKSLKPNEIHAIILAVCKELVKALDITFISDSEKKNSLTTQ